MTTALSASGIDVGERVIYLHDLEADLIAGGVAVPYGLTIIGPPQPAGSSLPLPNAPPFFPAGSRLFTYDDQGNAADLPPEAQPIVDAYTPS